VAISVLARFLCWVHDEQIDSFLKLIRWFLGLKVHLHEIFHFKLVWPKDPIWALEYPSKLLRFLASNSPRYSNFRAFRVLSQYRNSHSTHYQNTEIFIPCIISICTISFLVLSANAKFFLKWNIHSAYSQYELNWVPRILTIYYITFCVFLLWVKILSMYYQYMDNFIQRIIRKRQFFLRSSTYSWNYQYAPNFIWCIISISQISFHVLSAYVKFHSTFLATAAKKIWIFGLKLFSSQLLKG
jgi:hypothetical protein